MSNTNTLRLGSKSKVERSLEDALEILKRADLVEQINEHRWSLTRRGCAMLKYAPECVTNDFLENTPRAKLELVFALVEDALTMEEKRKDPKNIIMELKEFLSTANLS